MVKLITLSLLFILYGHILVTSFAERDVPDFAFPNKESNREPTKELNKASNKTADEKLNTLAAEIETTEIHSDSAVLEPAEPMYETLRLSQPITTEVHSASIAELPNGDLMAVWYGGSREGAKDVALYKALFAVGANQWGPTEVLLSRERTEDDLGRYIKKIGNPVLYADSQERLHLFFVSVSVGGWAGSAINHMFSDDRGKTWSKTKRLVSSPFLNISTLVKSPPFEFSDGTLGLPVYHEFMGKFSELIRLDSNYDVVEKVRIDKGRTNIQPVFLIKSPQQGEVLMRSVIREARVVFTALVDKVDQDQGAKAWLLQHETIERSRLTLPNPDSAIAAVADGNYGVLVYNHADDLRNVLSLAVRDSSLKQQESATWQRIHDFENAWDRPSERYSYPYLIQGQDGVFHLIYSWNRQYIKHIRFNYSWLLAQQGENS